MDSVNNLDKLNKHFGSTAWIASAGKVVVRRAFALLAFVCVFAVGVPEASARSLSAEQGGCRLLAGAYLRGFDAETLAQMKAQAVARLRQSKNPTAQRLASRDLLATPMYARDLGAWCKAHFPKDRVIQRARYPRGSESIEKRTLPTALTDIGP